MSISEIKVLLQDTIRAQAELERALKTDPQEETLLMMLNSLRQRRASLEEQFLNASAAKSLDICDYRLIADDSPVHIAALADVLKSFQEVFSIIYQSLKHGKKNRARVGTEVEAQTAFELAYTYSGSLGVVICLPDSPVLFGDTEFDQSFDLAISTLAIKNKEGIKNAIDQIGVASIRNIYKWAKAHVVHGISSDIKWIKDPRNIRHKFVSTNDFKNLVQLIDVSVEESFETIETTMQLVGIDIDRGTFHAKYLDVDIKGNIHISLTQKHYEIPKSYQVIIQKKTIVYLSKDFEENIYFLENIVA